MGFWSVFVSHDYGTVYLSKYVSKDNEFGEGKSLYQVDLGKELSWISLTFEHAVDTITRILSVD